MPKTTSSVCLDERADEHDVGQPPAGAPRLGARQRPAAADAGGGDGRRGRAQVAPGDAAELAAGAQVGQVLGDRSALSLALSIRTTGPCWNHTNHASGLAPASSSATRRCSAGQAPAERGRAGDGEQAGGGHPVEQRAVDALALEPGGVGGELARPARRRGARRGCRRLRSCAGR